MKKIWKQLTISFRLKPWEDHDLDLLFRLNAPEMMEHLGGPEGNANSDIIQKAVCGAIIGQ